jgi:transposase InsO family protein
VVRNCGRTPKKRKALANRTAEEGGQSINVDLCFVPYEHEGEIKLPAVSGSSGKLVVERTTKEKEETWYPGQIFGDEELSYEEAMKQFVTDSQAEIENPATQLSLEAAERAQKKAEKKLLRQKERKLTVERLQVRQNREREDAEWKKVKEERRQEKVDRKVKRAVGFELPHGSKKRADEAWREKRQRRQEKVAQRQRENEQWRQQRQEIRERLQRTRVITTWIAILVITDNCTRQCLGLPLFIAGSHLTAEMVVDALRELLPSELQFLISDRGVHFTAQVFQQLARDEDFIHVLIARHRPQSNGIAERFVRTLKEWLKSKSWQTHEELSVLLDAFEHEYNDRPHQGLPIPGLSPNEFANRLWLF